MILTKINKAFISFLLHYCPVRLIYFKPRYLRSKSSIYDDYLIVFYRLYNRCSIKQKTQRLS